MKNWIAALCMVLALTVSTASAERDKGQLLLLDIETVGASRLDEIKQHVAVEWWLEMGDRLVARTSAAEQAGLSKMADIIAVSDAVDINQLAFQAQGHCSHSEQEHAQMDGVDILFSGGNSHLVTIPESSLKATHVHSELMALETMKPFQENTVLSYRLSNRSKSLSRQSDPQMTAMVNQVNQNRWMQGVDFLASLNRQTEAGVIAAAEWLEHNFQDLGLETSRYYVTFQPGFNVLGVQTGTTRPDDWYFIGAHIDSRNERQDLTRPAPGAEDNASGCSAVLEIATILSQYETDATIIYSCFNAEELGLRGSRALVQKYINEGDLDKIQMMQNMDMISYRQEGDNRAIAGIDRPENQTQAEILAANGDTYSDLDWVISLNSCCTDFKSFADAGIPAMTSNQPNIWTYPDYHRVSDVPENLDPNLARGIMRANLATLAEVAGADLSSIVTYQISAAQSGLWYDPEQDGHGLSIDVLPNGQIVAIWYTYDQSGNQIWLLGVGEYTGSTAILGVTITEGGVFPPGFDPNDVVRSDWGEFQLDFTDCDNGIFSWSPADPTRFEAGSMPITRLTSIDTLSCQN